MRSLYILLFLFFAIRAYGQQDKIEVTLHSRVDTSNSEIRQIANLWINYLNSQPDSLYDNPYWNKAEKLKFKNFDFSARYLYQFSSKQLLRYYKPTILSIEKESDHYEIRTIFSADGMQQVNQNSNLWCITNLYAVKEDGEWKLKNALPFITENWNRRRIGKITFVYPPHHKFNDAMAKKANEFCNEISNEFLFADWTPFEFYITDTPDEMGRLLNFDFFYAGYTTGIGMNDNRILFSGMGSEYYPHEFVHLLIPNGKRHGMIEEGFATWKGGQGGKTFEESVRLLAGELVKNDTVTFSDVLEGEWGWQYASFYTTGAILLNSAYRKGGLAAIKILLDVPNDNAKLMETVCKLFEIDEGDIDRFWRNEVMNFKAK